MPPLRRCYVVCGLQRLSPNGRTLRRIGTKHMTLRSMLAASALALVTLIAAGANASVLYSAPGATGPMADDTSYSVNFNGPAGAANLSFVLDGYRSLDGQNYYEDDFTLNLNGTDILKGTFNLGGGGNDVVFFQPVGSTINNVSGNGTAVTWAGGHVNISSPLNLVAGNNILTFSYLALPYPGHAGYQSTGDEAWGVEQISVTTGGVPEPASWALMITGFGAAGSMLRRSRRQVAHVTA